MAKVHAVTREDHAQRAVDDIQGATLVPDPSAPLTWQVYRYQTDTHVGTVQDRDAEGWLSARPVSHLAMAYKENLASDCDFSRRLTMMGPLRH